MNLMRHCSAAASLLLVIQTAWAADVALAGLAAGRAVVVVNGGNPRTLTVGAKTPEGIKLVAIESGAAVFDIDGKQRRLVLGDQTVASGGSGGGGAVTLTADSRGQFLTQGSINGTPMRFMVDTGATLVALGASDAARAGIDYRGKGQPGAVATANGVIPAWKVPGNTVRLGDITLHEVDVSVSEAGMPFALLGMSVLNRLEMKRAGDTMTLKKRY